MLRLIFGLLGSKRYINLPEFLIKKKKKLQKSESLVERASVAPSCAEKLHVLVQMLIFNLSKDIIYIESSSGEWPGPA